MDNEKVEFRAQVPDIETIEKYREHFKAVHDKLHRYVFDLRCYDFSGLPYLYDADNFGKYVRQISEFIDKAVFNSVKLNNACRCTHVTENGDVESAAMDPYSPDVIYCVNDLIFLRSELDAFAAVDNMTLTEIPDPENIFSYDKWETNMSALYVQWVRAQAYPAITSRVEHLVKKAFHTLADIAYLNVVTAPGKEPWLIFNLFDKIFEHQGKRVYYSKQEIAEAKHKEEVRIQEQKKKEAYEKLLSEISTFITDLDGAVKAYYKSNIDSKCYKFFPHKELVSEVIWERPSEKIIDVYKALRVFILSFAGKDLGAECDYATFCKFFAMLDEIASQEENQIVVNQDWMNPTELTLFIKYFTEHGMEFCSCPSMTILDGTSESEVVKCFREKIMMSIA